MKKIIISFILLITLSGCWNYKELNEYAIITGVAIDKSEDNFEVSVLISNSSKSNEENSNSSSQTIVYSGKGKSIVEALKDIGKISPKELYFGSFSILVISEDVAREGINNAIDFFLRYSGTRKNFNIIISKDCKAKDSLKIITPITSFPSQNINDNINSSSKLQGIITKMDFNKLLTILLDEGIDPTINSISILGDTKIGSEKENLDSSEPETKIKLNTLGIFKGDKLVDWSNEEENLGINIINDEIDEMSIRIDTKDGYVVGITNDSKTKIKTKIENNIPVVDISVTGEMRIIECDGDVDLENIKTIESINKKVNEKIKEYINKGFNLAIKNKTDIFGFGLKFNQDHFNYYKTVKDEWYNNLDKIKLNISSNITIKSKVSAKNSLEEIYNEK